MSIKADYSSRNLVKLPSLENFKNIETLILRNNALAKLGRVEQLMYVKELNLSCNQLTSTNSIGLLKELTCLDASKNKIKSIDGVVGLSRLEKLLLSGNIITKTPNLSQLNKLVYLDLSFNKLASLPYLGNNTSCLETLYLDGNHLCSLDGTARCLPPTIRILGLSKNVIKDLSQMHHLSVLPAVEQLSVAGNPCLRSSGGPKAGEGFNYRPYLICCCPALKFVDGYAVTETEALKGEWLYCQGKGRKFVPGSHPRLVQYLASVCPLTEDADSLSTHEEVRMMQVLAKRREYLQQRSDGEVASGYPAYRAGSETFRKSDGHPAAELAYKNHGGGGVHSISSDYTSNILAELAPSLINSESHSQPPRMRPKKTTTANNKDANKRRSFPSAIPDAGRANLYQMSRTLRQQQQRPQEQQQQQHRRQEESQQPKHHPMTTSWSPATGAQRLGGGHQGDAGASMGTGVRREAWSRSANQRQSFREQQRAASVSVFERMSQSWHSSNNTNNHGNDIRNIPRNSSNGGGNRSVISMTPSRLNSQDSDELTLTAILDSVAVGSKQQSQESNNTDVGQRSLTATPPPLNAYDSYEERAVMSAEPYIYARSACMYSSAPPPVSARRGARIGWPPANNDFIAEVEDPVNLQPQQSERHRYDQQQRYAVPHQLYGQGFENKLQQSGDTYRRSQPPDFPQHPSEYNSRPQSTIYRDPIYNYRNQPPAANYFLQSFTSPYPTGYPVHDGVGYTHYETIGENDSEVAVDEHSQTQQYLSPESPAGSSLKRTQSCSPRTGRRQAAVNRRYPAYGWPSGHYSQQQQPLSSAFGNQNQIYAQQQQKQLYRPQQDHMEEYQPPASPSACSTTGSATGSVRKRWTFSHHPPSLKTKPLQGGPHKQQSDSNNNKHNHTHNNNADGVKTTPKPSQRMNSGHQKTASHIPKAIGTHHPANASKTSTDANQPTGIIRPYTRQHIEAAVKIQALWRGHLTRHRNESVLDCYRNIKLSRIEQTAKMALFGLVRMKHGMQEEKLMSQLLTELVKKIWLEIDSIKQDAAEKSISDTVPAPCSPIQPQMSEEELRHLTSQISELTTTVKTLKSQIVNLVPKPTDLSFNWKDGATGILAWKIVESHLIPDGAFYIFVNDISCGVVRGKKRKALVTDLQRTAVHRMTVTFRTRDGVESERSTELRVEPLKPSTNAGQLRTNASTNTSSVSSDVSNTSTGRNIPQQRLDGLKATNGQNMNAAVGTPAPPQTINRTSSKNTQLMGDPNAEKSIGHSANCAARKTITNSQSLNQTPSECHSLIVATDSQTSLVGGRSTSPLTKQQVKANPAKSKSVEPCSERAVNAKKRGSKIIAPPELKSTSVANLDTADKLISSKNNAILHAKPPEVNNNQSDINLKNDTVDPGHEKSPSPLVLRKDPVYENGVPLELLEPSSINSTPADTDISESIISIEPTPRYPAADGGKNDPTVQENNTGSEVDVEEVIIDSVL